MKWFMQMEISLLYIFGHLFLCGKYTVYSGNYSEDAILFLWETADTIKGKGVPETSTLT